MCRNFDALLFTAECDGLLDGDDNDDAKAREKDAALRLALSRLSGDFGRESMLSLQRFFRSRRPPIISTGSLKLDLALGIGGLPKVVNCVPITSSLKLILATSLPQSTRKFRNSAYGLMMVGFDTGLL